MGLFRRQDTIAAEQAGNDYGEQLADDEPGYQGRALAFKQVKAMELARANGLTDGEAFNQGMYEGYVKKARGR